MKSSYIETLQLIERLHRRFLDVVKTELDRHRIEDINNVQALILYNINDDELTVGELTNRGYYLGSNVSYNVKKLVEAAYLLQERATHDKRSTKIRLSPKGLQLCQKIDQLYQRNIKDLSALGLNDKKLGGMSETLHELERYWSDYINNSHRPGF